MLRSKPLPRMERFLIRQVFEPGGTRDRRSRRMRLLPVFAIETRDFARRLPIYGAFL